MRRTALLLALALAVVAGVALLREATQNRPDVVVEGSTTTIDFTVATQRYQRGETSAAVALWSVCSATVGGTASAVPAPTGDAWRVTVKPAIGHHSEQRLVGCLEDVTIDRVVGRVVTLREMN